VRAKHGRCAANVTVDGEGRRAVHLRGRAEVAGVEVEHDVALPGEHAGEWQPAAEVAPELVHESNARRAASEQDALESDAVGGPERDRFRPLPLGQASLEQRGRLAAHGCGRRRERQHRHDQERTHAGSDATRPPKLGVDESAYDPYPARDGSRRKEVVSPMQTTVRTASQRA
jgi:hypothetical protein